MKSEKPVILVVDDVPDNLLLASSLLQEFYRVKVAVNGEKALSIVAADPPDLILLDVMMPVMDGYETCRRLKTLPEAASIPVIFLTAKGEVEDEETGFQVGAVDYIVKPLTPALLLARINTHLTLQKTQNDLKDRNLYLEAEIAKRIEEVTVLQDVAITAMATLAESRDQETSAHVQRTAEYVKQLALQLRSHPKFSELLSLENIYLIAKSTPLHDIGKISIPSMILWKPGKLSREEFELVKKHPQVGKEAIVRAESLIRGPESFLRFAKEMAYSHHEKWDGSGYPEGLAGDEIPVSARLMAIADVYDVLISRRVYKDAIPHAKAVDIIRSESGKHFDPVMVEAFLSLADRFYAISQEYQDSFP